MDCRVCGKQLVLNIDFGPMPIANNFTADAAESQRDDFHMKTGVCPSCFTYQLIEQPAPEAMFHEHYPFFTSTSRRMVEHFGRVWRDVVRPLMAPGELVVEIGSNDGSFLVNPLGEGFAVLGIEPSKSVYDAAMSRGVRSIKAFFSVELAKRIRDEHGSAKVIFGANVICHIGAILDVFRAAHSLLSEGGWFIFEEPYVSDVLALNSFDQIYDEHVFLFSATSVAEIARRTGLTLERMDRVPHHGGSARYHLRKRPQVSSLDVLREEEQRGLRELATYQAFASRVRALRTAIPEFLGSAKRHYGRLYGYGATSKSTTINRYCGIGPELVEKVYDITPSKVNTYAPGSGIPVRSFDERNADDPRCFVLYAWNHKNEIKEKEAAFLASGGRFVEFFPRPGYC